MKFRVVEISGAEADPSDFPNRKNEEFPHLEDYVEDDSDLFVVAETGDWWPAREFFFMENVSEFFTDTDVL